MRCRAAFRLFDQHLISKSVCPNGEVSVGAWTNPLRNDFRTTHGLELLAEVGNRIHFQNWNGSPDGNQTLTDGQHRRKPVLRLNFRFGFAN